MLLVDDNDEISAVFQEGLENNGFDVVIASSVRRALSLITSEQFDVLLYDLHTPDASDVFVVVNALLHVHPNTVLLVLSRYPALQGGLSALLLKPDEILLKPVRIVAITQRIRKMLENPTVHRSVTTEIGLCGSDSSPAEPLQRTDIPLAVAIGGEYSPVHCGTRAWNSAAPTRLHCRYGG
jgi:DNA-binding response OmpR family regulator